MKVKQRKTAVKRRILKQKPPNPKMLKKLAVAILVTLIAAVLYTHLASHTQAAKDQRKLQQTYIQLNVNKEKLQKEINEHKLTNDEQQKKIDDLNKQLQDTQSQLQAKKDSATVYAATVPLTPAYTAPVTPAALPADAAKAYIYSHESGNNPGAQNAGGCYGLGQDCNGVVRNQCGADYACQDQYFTDYMLRRYGSWSAAVSFWNSQCSSPQGCWW